MEDALTALKDASEEVEAIIIQPYRTDVSFASTEKAVSLYRKLKQSKSIPILFAPQGRMSEEGQFFEYGARLFEVLDRTNLSKIEQNMKEGKWIFPANDRELYARNFLIVKKTIVRLPERLPISVAINVLRGKTQGEPVKAISIPAPKQMTAEYRNMLEIENFI